MELYKVEFYKKYLKWRWRAKSPSNGKITGASSESYWNKSDCEFNAERLGQSLYQRDYSDVKQQLDELVLEVSEFSAGKKAFNFTEWRQRVEDIKNQL